MNSLVHGIFFTKKTKGKTEGKIKNKLIYRKKDDSLREEVEGWGSG